MPHFGWEFEDRMPADSPGRYLVAKIRGRDVAAVGSPADETAPPVWSTYIWVDSADDAAAKVKNAGGSALVEPFDVPRRRTYGRVLRSVRRRVLRVAGEQAQGGPRNSAARSPFRPSMPVWFRVAVLSDPQGAIFTVSKYDPG